MIALRSIACAALGFGALAACAVGPEYSPPSPLAPQAGTFASPTPTDASANQPPANWWELYNTPAIDRLVQAALMHNQNLLMAAANLAEARASLSQARAGQFPSTTLSAGAQYGVTDNEAFAANLLHRKPASPEPNYSAGLDVSYEVDLFGQVRRAIEAASANYEAQKAAEDVMRVSVAGETTRAYLDACAYAEEYDVAKHSLDVVAESEDITAREVRDGTASDFDLARARELEAQTRATLPTYEGQRRTALFELAVLTGRPPEEISQDADACRSPPKLKAVLPIGDVKSLFRRRPDVREAERQLASNVAQIGVETANLYPTITIGASGSTGANTLPGLSSVANLSYGIGPLLSWSFPNILVAEAQIREARATASASYANFQATVLQALQDTEDALTAYGSELDRNASLAIARDQSETAFKLAQSRYRLGSASYLDVLTAETDLVNAASMLAASDQALASDQVTVFKALGGGWEQAPQVQPLPIIDGRTGKAEKVK
ncbi:MAG: efflux transporter outer membrane subunit [Rhizomicrobium sp.]|jgi:NodT family efflux transporter outer membrane factor (OMF) lipoprotein